MPAGCRCTTSTSTGSAAPPRPSMAASSTSARRRGAPSSSGPTGWGPRPLPGGARRPPAMSASSPLWRPERRHERVAARHRHRHATGHRDTGYAGRAAHRRARLAGRSHARRDAAARAAGAARGRRRRAGGSGRHRGRHRPRRRPPRAAPPRSRVPTPPRRVEATPDVHEIERASFPVPWPAYAFRQELETNRLARYLVARAGGKAVGYGGIWLMVDEAHITTFAVLPAWRRQGIGARLLLALLDLAVEVGATGATREWG